MRIISLQAENLKRLVAVEITPDGALVEITGKNGAGKTSVLDAIWWALAGTADIQAEPIRKGEEKAVIRLDLGDLKVTRRFNRQEDGTFTTSLTVENAEGARYPSPQAMLEALVGELTFDPLEFTRKSSREQFESLKRLVPGVDFAEVERANRSDYEERTVVNRRARELGALVANLPAGDDAPTEPADETALIAELENAGEANAALERRKANRETFVFETESKEQGVKILRTRIEIARKEIEKLVAEADADEAECLERRKKIEAAEPLAAPIDTTAIRKKIDEAKRANFAYGAANRRKELEAEARTAEAKSDALTKAIDDRNAEKQKAVASAELPVPGLGFGDDLVLLGGVPFDQASDAEQLRASIAIAGAMNPKLRVLRVRDGSLLDAESMALLAEFAAERDLQVWIETVQSGRPGAILIEDGRVKEPAPKKARAKESAA